VKADLWGGPHDGVRISVPDHLTELRMPVPVRFEPTLVGLPPLTFPVALYERTAVVRPHGYVYRYKGQE
jgi:hypothetical protein